jgi:hypothetical protein
VQASVKILYNLEDKIEKALALHDTGKSEAYFVIYSIKINVTFDITHYTKLSMAFFEAH